MAAQGPVSAGHSRQKVRVLAHPDWDTATNDIHAEEQSNRI